MMPATQLPPDDDPGFYRWVREIGPLHELEFPTKTGSPVMAAVAVTAAVLGMTVALVTTAALVFNAITPLGAVLVAGAGTLTTLVSLAYLIWRAT